MEHKRLGDVRGVAHILPNWLSPSPLSQSERLECWAKALEREGGRPLRTLYQVEYAPPAERSALRADDSPLSVAFNDPRLRAEGLAGDTMGAAVAFFGISEGELHDILCYCHHGATMTADVAALRIRAAVARRS
jgi:hypothetical protein